MVGGGGNGVGALGDHAGTAHVRPHLGARQMAADARLGSLAHLDLDGGSRLQKVLMHAEAPGGHLDDGVGTILIEILVEPALAGVVAGAQLCGRPGQGGMGVVADAAVAHGGEHHRHTQLQLRGEIGFQPPVLVPGELLRLLPQEDPGLHGLPQGVNGGVRHLGGIDQELIPIDRQGLWVSHAGQQHPAGRGLLIDLPNGIGIPVGVFPQAAFGSHDLQRPGGAQRNAALAVDALGFVREHQIPFRVVQVHLVGALPLADPAADAPVFPADDLEIRIEEIYTAHQNWPSFTRTITGSPPAGA